MTIRRRVVIALVAALANWPALADPLPRITPRDAYAEIERSGALRRLQIDGDLDAAKMKPPPGAKRIVLQEV